MMAPSMLLASDGLYSTRQDCELYISSAFKLSPLQNEYLFSNTGFPQNTDTKCAQITTVGENPMSIYIDSGWIVKWLHYLFKCTVISINSEQSMLSQSNDHTHGPYTGSYLLFYITMENIPTCYSTVATNKHDTNFDSRSRRGKLTLVQTNRHT